MPALTGIPLGLLARARASLRKLGLRKLHSGAARLGQSYGNRLFGRARAMLPLADVMNLFAYKFARLH